MKHFTIANAAGLISSKVTNLLGPSQALETPGLQARVQERFNRTEAVGIHTTGARGWHVPARPRLGQSTVIDALYLSLECFCEKSE
jgi:hypothetical protein